ncbi:NAD(P)-dependent oxidoreductase [Siculibacillus lacustris]|uniref:NAD(P)-dependent oxidoreductase n=1 Tax=Siculibacillus lacustris TaxID=1549641 RepID=A0A4Q9VNN4_9HYPH|nr:NAD-dependent epimerase/dehydratase family protein [Siculibacillus lacustris]TBW36429.1 NAD(P)-dependent oxidoreductase [Siculibacillus lacustris]
MTRSRLDLLVLGYGYSARHAVAELRPDLTALTVTARAPAKAARLAANGLAVIALGEPDADAALAAAVARASHILVSAGPSADGDPFLLCCAAPLAAAAAAGTLEWIGYLSTVGVYGDAAGGLVDETTPAAPASERTRWRVAAESAWAALGHTAGVPVALLRLAGIYGPGRNAFVALERGTARRIVKPGQMFNRIHVADLGRAAAAAARLRFDGILNVCDDQPSPPDLPILHAAELMGVAPPPAIPFETAEFSPMARSFWSENKRVSNARLRGLGVTLAHPTWRSGLDDLWRSDTWRGSPEDQDDASPKFKR